MFHEPRFPLTVFGPRHALEVLVSVHVTDCLTVRERERERQWEGEESEELVSERVRDRQRECVCRRERTRITTAKSVIDMRRIRWQTPKGD